MNGGSQSVEELLWGEPQQIDRLINGDIFPVISWMNSINNQTLKVEDINKLKRYQDMGRTTGFRFVVDLIQKKIAQDLIVLA